MLQALPGGTAARYLRLVRALATRDAFQARFFYDRSAVRRAAVVARGSFDAVVCGQLYMYPYVPADLRPITLLDAHNAELDRVESIARAAGLTARGLAARLQRGPVRAYEAHAATEVARVTAVSRSDAQYFEALAPGRVDLVPNGVDCAAIEFRPQPGGRRILFLGSLDYSANVDAFAYLVREVLPRVTQDVELDVVGSSPRRSLQRLARNAPVRVSIAGHVPDTEPWFTRARMLVVPLRYGGGTRLKILEALARGTPVVSTSIGCAGLELAGGDDLLVADGPDELARAIRRLLEDDELCTRLAEHGRATVERRYDWSTIGGAFEEAVAKAAGAGG